MNFSTLDWYKLAINQQKDFPFYKQIQPIPIEETEQYKKSIPKTKDSLEEILADCQNISEAIQILKKYNFSFKIIEDIVVVNLDKPYILDSLWLNLKDPHEWIWSLYDSQLDKYVNYPEFNEEFWNNPFPVYHATSEENWNLIQKTRIDQRDKTRGIENRSTGSAVFTSDNPDDIEPYGNVIIEINTKQMKQDGYMPTVSKEEPIEEAEKREAIAHMIGLEDFYAEVEQGISPTTIIFFGHIPSKYLRKL